MKVILIICLGMMLNFPTSVLAATPQTDEESAYRELLIQKHEFNKASRTSKQSKITSSDWPSTRPQGLSPAITMTSYSYSYDLYIWWSKEGYLFAEAVPLYNTEAFICSASWMFVQTINQTASAFDTVYFADIDDNSICGDFTDPVIFRIGQWNYLYSYYVNYNYPFNMVYGWDARKIVTINGGVHTSSGTVSDALDITIESIDFLSSSIWLNLQFDGNNDNGELIWKLDSAGFN
ncbi:MAG: hypothetical protein R3332_10370 [Pseudohongiellaceae bacterium]|nr:hypothetical protein [Pseudohongiellaceae bacterium]